jgi:hypothetical protein
MCSFKKKPWSRTWWYISIIPATQKAEVGKLKGHENQTEKQTKGKSSSRELEHKALNTSEKKILNP